MSLDETRERIRQIVSGPGDTSRWIARHLDFAERDWCLIYPFSWEEDHYPKYKNMTGGHHHPVHRLMCEYRNGPAPSPGHQAAHSCHRGTKGCVNPMHLTWKTPSENQKDRFRGHAIMPRAKLNQEQVDEIRLRAATEMPGELAKRFGVTVRNIRWVVQGKTWNPVRKISP